MGLLQDIQSSLLDENARITPILLKLRFLADRLESNLLEDWVRYETEGYPDRKLVPKYRHVGLHYVGTLTDGYRTLNNNGIPLNVIKRHCGDHWSYSPIKESLSVVEDMISRSKDKDTGFGIDVSGLKFTLDSKIYEGFSVIDLRASFSSGALVGIVNTVRSKLLDFVLELERKVPISADITVGKKIEMTPLDAEKVTHITQHIFHGTVNNITASGTGSAVTANIIQGNIEDLKIALKALGLPTTDANELAKIVSEEDQDPSRSIGQKASEWLGKRVSMGADGLLRIGGKILEKDITEAIRHFYDNLV